MALVQEEKLSFLLSHEISSFATTSTREKRLFLLLFSV